MSEPYREDGRVEQLQEENALLKQEVRSLESRNDELVRSLMKSHWSFWSNFLPVIISGALCGGLFYALTVTAFPRGGAVGLLEEDQEEVAERVAKRTQAQIQTALSEKLQVVVENREVAPSAPVSGTTANPARTIGLNQVLRGTLNDERRAEWFQYQARVGETVVFRMKINGEANSAVRIFNSQGEDQTYACNYCSYNDGAGYSLVQTFSASGVYTVKVVISPARTFLNSSVNYTLSARPYAVPTE